MTQFPGQKPACGKGKDDSPYCEMTIFPDPVGQRINFGDHKEDGESWMERAEISRGCQIPRDDVPTDRKWHAWGARDDVVYLAEKPDKFTVVRSRDAEESFKKLLQKPLEAIAGEMFIWFWDYVFPQSHNQLKISPRF